MITWKQLADFWIRLADRVRGCLYGLRHGHRKLSTDSLTELLTRDAFANEYRGKLERRAKKDGRRIAIVFIDVDNLKLINDMLGHQAGDYLLQEFSGLIQASIRCSDFPFRWGGDEIVLFLPDAGQSVVERLLAKLEQRFQELVASDSFRNGIKFCMRGSHLEARIPSLNLILGRVGFSAGYSFWERRADDMELLGPVILRADARMVKNKHRRKVSAIS